MFSDSSSSASEARYSGSRQLMSSPLKDTTLFSDQIGSRSGSSSSGYRKRTYNSFEHPGSSGGSRKRFRSSPTAGRSLHSSRTSWRGNNHFAQSSPLKPRNRTHFTTSSGPGLAFYPGNSHTQDDLSSSNFASLSDDEENSLPLHSFNVRSSPPRTPSPPRNLGHRNVDRHGKSGEEGADLLLYLATSPSPANPKTRARMQPPSTPPPKNSALPSSMMTTPGGSGSMGLLGVFGAPNTPSQTFDFADFVNITPSPAQSAWPKTPRTAKTPMTITRRGLTFDNFLPLHASPKVSNSTAGAPKHTGLGMQLGGDLLS